MEKVTHCTDLIFPLCDIKPTNLGGIDYNTPEMSWVSGNYASAPKPCPNPESSSDEGCVRSNAVV